MGACLYSVCLGVQMGGVDVDKYVAKVSGKKTVEGLKVSPRKAQAFSPLVPCPVSVPPLRKMAAVKRASGGVLQVLHAKAARP